MLDPKLGLTLRARTAISMLVTACALAILLSAGARDHAPAPRTPPSAPFDPLRAPPSMYAEDRVAYIPEGGLDGAQTHLTARATERAGGGSRRRHGALRPGNDVTLS